MVRRKINMIIIHHTAGRDDESLDSILAGHKKRGFGKYIGYHCVIDRAGGVHKTRPEAVVPCAAAGANAHSLNVSVVGYYHPGPEPWMNKRLNPSQEAALINTCAEWCIAYGITPGAIYGHRNAPGHTTGTACPGDFIFSELPRLEIAVEEKIKAIKEKAK